MADNINLGLFQSLRSVNFPSKKRIGLIIQVGRWRTTAGIQWQVQGSAVSISLDCGTFGGSTPINHEDSITPPVTNMAFNTPAYDPIIEGEFGFAAQAGNRSAVFNFAKIAKARGNDAVPDVITATLNLGVFGLSNDSQWHFNFDTFTLPDDIEADPTFTQGQQLDNPAAKFGSDFLGSSPLWVPVGAHIDTGTLYVPHTSTDGILTSATVATTINTKTGAIGTPVKS